VVFPARVLRKKIDPRAAAPTHSLAMVLADDSLVQESPPKARIVSENALAGLRRSFRCAESIVSSNATGQNDET
jgi:hypothetical protein